MTISAKELALWASQHHKQAHASVCWGCTGAWPCTTRRLIEALEASQEMHVEDVRELQGENKRLRAQLKAFDDGLYADVEEKQREVDALRAQLATARNVIHFCSVPGAVVDGSLARAWLENHPALEGTP